jgi:hypothetical protein
MEQGLGSIDLEFRFVCGQGQRKHLLQHRRHLLRNLTPSQSVEC